MNAQQEGKCAIYRHILVTALPLIALYGKLLFAATGQKGNVVVMILEQS